MNKVRAAALLLLVFSAASSGVQPDYSYSGFAELRAHSFRSGQRSHYDFSELLRTDFHLQFTERVLASATVEAGLTQQRTFDDRAAHSSGMRTTSSGYLELERLFMDAYLPAADLRVGRQAVNWGSAFLVNPTDPFPELLETEPWRSRSGINAARATVRFGNGHQNQSLLGMDDDFRYLLAATRTTLRLGPADLAFSGVWREEAEAGLAGIDLRGNFGIGYWFEGGMHLDGSKAREELAIGADYSFPVMENLVITVQYYRNDTADMRDASDNGEAVVGNGGSIGGGAVAGYTGNDFAMFSVAAAATRDFSFSTLLVQSLDSSSGLVVPVAVFTPGGRWELSAAAQLFYGDGSSLRDSAGRSVVRDTYIAWARMTF